MRWRLVESEDPSATTEAANVPGGVALRVRAVGDVAPNPYALVFIPGVVVTDDGELVAAALNEYPVLGSIA